MSRVEEIETRLYRHFHEVLGCTVKVRSLDEWLEHAAPVAYGWIPPTRSDSGIHMAFCPEMLDAMTVDLDDSELHRFLTVLETYVDAHLAYPDRSPEQVTHDVEDELYAAAPKSFRLYSEVQMRALSLWGQR